MLLNSSNSFPTWGSKKNRSKTSLSTLSKVITSVETITFQSIVVVLPSVKQINFFIVKLLNLGHEMRVMSKPKNDRHLNDNTGDALIN